jgi:hypothetical protein
MLLQWWQKQQESFEATAQPMYLRCIFTDYTPEVCPSTVTVFILQHMVLAHYQNDWRMHPNNGQSVSSSIQ